MIRSVNSMKTPDQLVEEGIGLIAQGLFRASKQHGPQEAREMCEAARRTLSGMWQDFAKQDKEFIKVDPRETKTR